MTVEDTMNLPVIVTLLSENVLPEHQLHLQAGFIAVLQCGKYSLFVGRVVVGPALRQRLVFSKSSIQKLDMPRDGGEPMATPLICP
jgi:hypothetical protein